MILDLNFQHIIHQVILMYHLEMIQSLIVFSRIHIFFIRALLFNLAYIVEYQAIHFLNYSLLKSKIV